LPENGCGQSGSGRPTQRSVPTRLLGWSWEVLGGNPLHHFKHGTEVRWLITTKSPSGAGMWSLSSPIATRTSMRLMHWLVPDPNASLRPTPTVGSTRFTTRPGIHQEHTKTTVRPTRPTSPQNSLRRVQFLSSVMATARPTRPITGLHTSRSIIGTSPPSWWLRFVSTSTTWMRSRCFGWHRSTSVKRQNVISEIPVGVRQGK
jgi:hypothetical protein